MRKDTADIIRNFGMSNQMAEVALDKIEKKYSIDFGRPTKRQNKDTKYYPQFEEKIRKEAAEMARHYEVFYCLENTIRRLISQRLQEEFGNDWWEAFHADGKEVIPQNVKDNASKSRKNEIKRAITPRSNNIIDYTTFGELGEIINANWNIFGDTFMSSDQSAVGNVMALLNTLRGPIAHCSSLADHEVARLHHALEDWFRISS